MPAWKVAIAVLAAVAVMVGGLVLVSLHAEPSQRALERAKYRDCVEGWKALESKCVARCQTEERADDRDWCVRSCNNALMIRHLCAPPTAEHAGPEATR